MKQIKTGILLLIALTGFTLTHAQETKIDSFKVWGNCNMCKKTIEKASNNDAVSKADWNKDTKIFTVSYNPAAITNEKIQKAIAAVGYDTEKFTGDDKAYEKLPGCCHYERKKKEEKNDHSNHKH